MVACHFINVVNSKVEGVKTNTPPNRQHSIILNYFPLWSSWAHGTTILGVINGATSYRPPLPSYRVSHMIHSISNQFKVDLGWFVIAYSSHFIHKVIEVGPQNTKKLGSMHKQDWYP